MAADQCEELRVSQGAAGDGLGLRGISDLDETGVGDLHPVFVDPDDPPKRRCIAWTDNLCVVLTRAHFHLGLHGRLPSLRLVHTLGRQIVMAMVNERLACRVRPRQLSIRHRRS